MGMIGGIGLALFGVAIYALLAALGIALFVTLLVAPGALPGLVGITILFGLTITILRALEARAQRQRLRITAASPASLSPVAFLHELERCSPAPSKTCQ
jgi:hypothetical protein